MALATNTIENIATLATQVNQLIEDRHRWRTAYFTLLNELSKIRDICNNIPHDGQVIADDANDADDADDANGTYEGYYTKE